MVVVAKKTQALNEWNNGLADIGKGSWLKCHKDLIFPFNFVSLRFACGEKKKLIEFWYPATVALDQTWEKT